MQEMVEWIEQRFNNLQETEVLKKATELLEKEKSVAEKIWNDIFNNDTLIYNDFESYWNDFYKTKK